MKLRDLFLVEFKIANQPDPKDRDDYKAKMASLQDIQKDPRMGDARTQAVIAKRKVELRRWAEKNLRTEDNVQERMPASVIKSKQRYADMTDQELADRFKDSDEKTLRQMAWRHGYGNMSSHYFDRVQKGKSQTEDGVQPTDMKRVGAMGKTLYVHKDGKTIMIPAEREKDFIQKGFKRSALRTEETNEGEMRLDKSAFVQMLADKIKEPQKGHGRPEYDNRLLAKMYKLITGKDVDFEGNKFTITMNKPASEETVQEDAPFDGMSLVRMALMKKFITAEEWHGLKDKWKNAVAELEQRYNDWPDGEGFGSSDHNFAIKELMELVGYEFDDKDTSGRFVVSKMPPELEKMGLKNARMKDAVATEDSVKEGASMIPYFKTEKDFDGEKTTVYEFPMAWAKDKELDTPYLSNASMREFLTGLGYSGDFENMSAVPVDEFIGVSTQWLKKNIGKRSPEEPTTIDKNPDGPTMISGGKPEGYMNQQVKLHNELARKIKSKYPEVTHLGFN